MFFAYFYIFWKQQDCINDYTRSEVKGKKSTGQVFPLQRKARWVAKDFLLWDQARASEALLSLRRGSEAQFLRFPIKILVGGGGEKWIKQIHFNTNLISEVWLLVWINPYLLLLGELSCVYFRPTLIIQGNLSTF